MRPGFAGSLASAALVAALASPAGAHTVHVPPLPGAAAAALSAAKAGDTVVLGRGVHAGPLVITTPVTLRGEPGAVVDGGGRGSVIRVAAGGTVIERLAVRGSGRDVMNVDSGVQVMNAEKISLRHLEIRDVLYGVYSERTTRLEVSSCTVVGRVQPMDESGEGNGIHLWYSNDALIRGNRVERFLDGIYLSFANGVRACDNVLQWNGRYGLHTMYNQENRLERNTFALNVAGCALMFSNGLVVERNDFVHNRGPRTYGLLLRDCSAGTFADNRLADNTIAVFMDGSNRNTFRANLVENNGWGLLLFSSCDGNVFAGNDFIQNDYPVALDMRRTDNRFDDGRVGNYWSENAPYDLDADGLSDVPYSPVNAFAFVSKQYPDLTILAKSPAVAALGVAERVFPALRPSEAVDRFPLVRPARLGRHAAAGVPRMAAGPNGLAMAAFAALAVLGLAGIALAARIGRGMVRFAPEAGS